MLKICRVQPFPRRKEIDLLMDFSGLHNLSSYLEGLEESWYSYPVMKSIVQRIMLKIDRLISEWSVDEHGNLEVSVLKTVIQKLKRVRVDLFCVSEDRRSTPPAGKHALSNLEKLRYIKPEIEEMYSIAFKSSRSKSSKDVLSLISFLSEDPKDILSSEAGILIQVRPQILALQDELRFLRNFLDFVSRIRHEHLVNNDLLIFAQAVAVNFAYILHFLRVDKKMDEEMVIGVRIELLDLLEKLNRHQQPELRVIYLRALEGTNPKLLTKRYDTCRFDPTVREYKCVQRFVDCMIENLGKTLDKANVEFTGKNQIENLQSDLIFLRETLTSLPYYDAIEELNCRTRYFIYSSAFIDDKFTDLASNEKLGGLKIEGVKSESHHFNMPQSWQSNFPETNELECVDIIIKNLKERLHNISSPIDPLTNQVNIIYKELLALRDNFGRVAKHWNEKEELKALFSRYRDAAYQAEYFVDSFLCGLVPFSSQKMGLVNLVRDLSSIKKELEFILNDNIGHGICRSISSMQPRDKSLIVSDVLDSEHNARNIKDKDFDQLVGFEDEKKKMIDKVLGGSDQLTILSIIGMPGLGKTTLGNSVYKDTSVTTHFHARAWCSVSQEYNKENLLLEILHQVKPKSSEDNEKNQKCFDQKLHQSLKGKRYLVIMDDVWDIEGWNDLRPSFPDDNNGSRIIFTTRYQSIAIQANSVPHALRLLSDEESWKLLQVRVFREEKCPPELFHVGKKIAKNCKSLPLTVVLVAGLLKVIERKECSWEQFAEVLISREVDYLSEQHFEILDLSYRHLPNYLKPCFLYFGSFPEDATIPVWKLLRLWIAEGFVQPKAGIDSLELEAENYLNALIDRSLVTVAKRSYNGIAKECRIHDLLHDFCIDRAREERFLLKIKRGDSLSTLTDYEMHEQYRLCIVQSNTRTAPLIRTRHLESRIRSLQFFVEANLYENFSSLSLTAYRNRIRCCNELYVIAVLLKFRLLKVLDLGTLNIAAEDSLKTITQLFHLRYLSLLAYTREIPAEIENLKNLETFLLTGTTREGEVTLPVTIWTMVNLQHIQIKKRATASLPFEDIENCNRLDGMTSLSNLVFHKGNEVDKMIKMLPNLKQLKCEVYGSWDDSKNHSPLSVLHQLEELSISYMSRCIVFPPGLKKLKLKGIMLSEDDISAVGELPNLEVLKLVHVVMGEEWAMKEGEFNTLKFLKLDSLKICKWVASMEHLPCLELLVVKECRDLKELPSIGENPFLRMIDVSYCKNSVVDSARKIQEEQYELGNDQFNLCCGFSW